MGIFKFTVNLLKPAQNYINKERGFGLHFISRIFPYPAHQRQKENNLDNKMSLPYQQLLYYA